jgi:phosphoribosylaminoimidazole-succinocarboxamide synthase
MENKEILLTTELSEFKLFKKGKVRDIYELDDTSLLFIATDRISAFDVILPNGIPHKGKVLTALSKFWFDFTKDIIDNHLLTSEVDSIVPLSKEIRHIINGRYMVVKKIRPIPIECVVRGYIAGSAWKEYKNRGTVCGIELPKGLRESDKLPYPIFTPATKEEGRHDINISIDEMERIIEKDKAKILIEKSIKIYKKAAEYAESRGIIIADTKFEFGINDNRIILIDELLTPDSSRFWPLDEYEPDRPQKSFDKQFVRDYLEGLNWNKKPPAPKLPEDIIKKTSDKYIEAFVRLTGKKLENILT